MPQDLDAFYDEFPRIEPAFNAALSRSLKPRGPEVLYDLVAAMTLPPGSGAVDVGCGEGRHSVRLAERFGLSVVGVDPVARHVELARAAGAAAAPGVAARLHFDQGTADALPLPDGSADLVWCRDVLVHIADLESAFREFRRVLRDGGRVLAYQTVAGDRLEPREADWLFRTMHVVAASADAAHVRTAVAAAGLRIVEWIDLRSEWGESAEEHDAAGTGRLLGAARLLRDPDRYVNEFGREAYEIMLGDCLWHVYGLIGKLDAAAYVLACDR
jgi:SAM-dependent methyltransferase